MVKRGGKVQGGLKDLADELAYELERVLLIDRVEIDGPDAELIDAGRRPGYATDLEWVIRDVKKRLEECASLNDQQFVLRQTLAGWRWSYEPEVAL